MSSALAVVDLAVPPAALEPAPEARTLKLVFLWNGAAVGEQLIELVERPGTLAIPEAILRQARETELTERLRPSLAPAPARKAPSVSVVVCTLGRPGPLAACLASLNALRRTPGEVLVVNNNPSDARPRTVAEHHGARVVDEPRRGLSAARNAGIRAARGELVAFIDDDCEVAPGWLEDLARDFEDPLVAVVVGYVGPRELETEAQWLFEAQGGFERHFRRERFDGAADGPWAAGGLGDGNSFFRRSVLEAHGGFSEVMGPGTAARSAQDADLFHRLLGHGWRLQFTPARVAWHRHRRELEALAATLEGYTTGLSAHAARSLLGRRDLTALRMWHWWARRYFPQLARDALRDPRSGRWLLLGAQARGALLGPLRARDALRGGGPEPGIAPRPAPAATERVAVTAELPAASVVLASHDRRDRLVQTLRALRGQTLPPERFEVVVILDGSTDGSLEAARALESELPLRVEAQASLGLATSRNRGAELSGHPLVVFLDDDIVPEPGLVAAHAAAHAGGREAVVMGYHPPVVDLERWWAQGVRAWWEDHFRRKRAPGWHPTFVDYCDGNSSLPRALFQRLGGFDEAFSGGRRQDWELAIRALAEGVAFRMEHAARATHHADDSFATALRSSHQEGRYDVVLVRKHPLAAGRLRLGRTGPPPRMRRRAAIRLGRGVDDARWIAAADALEAARARGTWRRLTGVALELAYDAGADEALAPGERAALLAPVERGEDVLALDFDPARPELRGPGAHPGRVVLRLPGGETVPVLEMERGWDAEALLERVAATLAAGEALAPSTLAVR